MGPIRAVDSVFSKFFTLRGRASRSEYWWFQLMSVLILCAAVAGDLWLFDPAAPLTLNPFAYFTSTWVIVIFIPQFTVTVRRLHDSGKSGLWYLTFLLPFVGWLFHLVTMLLPSDHGDNFYGPPPFGGGGSRYMASDPGDPTLTPRRPRDHNPYAGYALLDQANRPVTAEMQAARKAQMQDYYRTRVLGQAPAEDGAAA